MTPREAGALGRAGEHGVEVGLRRVGDPALLAGQPPTAGGGVGAQGEGRRVGARTRFAECEGGDGATRPHLGEPAIAVRRGARPDQGVGAEALEGQRGLGLRAAAGQGLAEQTEVEGAGVQHPVQQARLAECGDQGAVDMAGVALLGEGAQLLFGKGS